MRIKGDISVALQYRDKLSVGPNRAQLSHAAFHWSIIIKLNQTNQYHRFDVTDGIFQDPLTNQTTNIDQNWVHRHMIVDKTSDIPRYLGRAVIGTVILNTTELNAQMERIKGLMKGIDVPGKKDEGVKELNWTCVNWTANAIQVLQDAGLCDRFGVVEFKDRLLDYGDARIAHGEVTPDVTFYPPRMVTGKEKEKQISVKRLWTKLVSF